MKKNENKNNTEQLSWVSWMLIAIAIVLVTFSLIPFWLNNDKVVDFVNTVPMGDTISDIMTPLISIASVSMMFLAFYMQFRANKLVIKQFEKTQFENRFFQLLNVHKENAKALLDSFYAHEEATIENAPLKAIRRRRFEYIVTEINNAYHEKIKELEGTDYDPRKVMAEVWSSQWIEDFGHYFRHLYMMVRFIATKDFLSYEQQRDYVRVLRACLSTYEQVLLYYDWLVGDGGKWEDEDNRFFSDYRVIHNIEPDLIIPEFDVRNISPLNKMIKNGGYMKEHGRPDDLLFEFQSRIRGRL